MLRGAPRADFSPDRRRLTRVFHILEVKIPGGGEPSPTLPLVRALLVKGRLLVILDHFSELGDERQSRLSPITGDFPKAWTVVTSRRVENFGERVVHHLKPQRFTADRLWTFFTDYLRLLEADEALDFDLHSRAVNRLLALAACYLEMTIPDKPKSSRQKYRLTPAGHDFLKTLPDQQQSSASPQRPAIQPLH